METLSLLELNALVRRSLEQCLPDEEFLNRLNQIITEHLDNEQYRALLSGIYSERSP